MTCLVSPGGRAERLRKALRADRATSSPVRDLPRSSQSLSSVSGNDDVPTRSLAKTTPGRHGWLSPASSPGDGPTSLNPPAVAPGAPAATVWLRHAKRPAASQRTDANTSRLMMHTLQFGGADLAVNLTVLAAGRPRRLAHLSKALFYRTWSLDRGSTWTKPSGFGAGLDHRRQSRCGSPSIR